MKATKRALLFFKRGFNDEKVLMERLDKSVIIRYLNFKE
ncbi:hypothetical protein HPHPH43_0975 [Helicobacter pylori Hp H-43]|nr:hypothetical protein HPHPH43_0975 [Helicobacter pylori Hp H-43]